MQRLLFVLLPLTIVACAKGPTARGAPSTEATATDSAPSSASLPQRETPPQEETAASNSRCALDNADTSTWLACDGKTVQLTGPKATLITQHPIAFDPQPNAPRAEQHYLDIAGRQVVVAAHEDPACEGDYVVNGTLRRVDLGGEPGTRGSYQGWSVTNATLSCR